MFKIHVPELITSKFLLFIKPDFTTNAQNIRNFKQCTHGNIMSWIVTLFQMSRGGCKNGVRGSRHALMKFIFILNWR
jgi:hypothetical protein